MATQPEKKKMQKRKALALRDYVRGIQKCDRTILGRAISLIESQVPEHQKIASNVLTAIMPHTGDSLRLGITGVPGAGKSTLIEALGLHLIEQGHRVAVLAVDPTSSLSGGSILGDKTRMGHLARNPGAFIRPSPSGGALGGVARKTRESLLICEAAGFDVIIVETVGVGQSEIAVRSMVDFFLLLQIPGAGDELQGMKRGVMEICDAVFINKADGENKVRAEAAQKEFNLALHYLSPATPGWRAKAYTCSALTGEGIPELWKVVLSFKETTTSNGVFKERRQQQAKAWMADIINEYLQNLFWQNAEIKPKLQQLEAEVLAGTLPPTSAAEQILKLFEQQLKKK